MKKNYFIIFTLYFFAIGQINAQFTVLHNFNDTDGRSPQGDLTLSSSGGTLYGMTTVGGANGWGSIFSISIDGSRYREIWNFDDTGSNGANPQGSLTLINNKLYGMTRQGGIHNGGNIFSIDTNGGNYNDMFDFNTSAYPHGILTPTGNKLFGMTSYGGTNDSGNIFSIDTNGENYKDVFDFNFVSGGVFPFGSLSYSEGILFGMTSGSATLLRGNIFSIDTNGNDYRNLFNFNYTNGAYPEGDLTLAGKMLYGVTWEGSSYFVGNIFSVDTNGLEFTDMHDFNYLSGADSYGSNLTLIGNTLCGMTYNGGLYNDGCIYTIDTNGNGYADLFDFDGTNGAEPYFNSFILSGNVLYGMTGNGGTNFDGVIFSFKDIGLGIDNFITRNGGINLYPNPNNGIFTILLTHPAASGFQTIEIYNVLGEQVLTETLQPQTPKGAFPKGIHSENNVNISNQPSGVYLYRVIAENGELIVEGKLVVEH